MSKGEGQASEMAREAYHEVHAFDGQNEASMNEAIQVAGMAVQAAVNFTVRVGSCTASGAKVKT